MSRELEKKWQREEDEAVENKMAKEDQPAAASTSGPVLQGGQVEMLVAVHRRQRGKAVNMVCRTWTTSIAKPK